MMKYYLRPDSNTPPAYVYIEGDTSDSLWNSDTCIEVPKKPERYYDYDLETSQWVVTDSKYLGFIKAQVKLELERTKDIILFGDEIAEEELSEAKTYRNDLKTLLTKTTVADIQFPLCPDCLKETT